MGGSFTGQNSGADKGPFNATGLNLANNQPLQQSPNASDDNTGLLPQNYKAITESGWVVYSRRRRDKKKFLQGHHVPIPMSEITGPNLMNQGTHEGLSQKEFLCSQQGVQHNEGDSVELTHDNDAGQNNEEGRANPELHYQQYQEAMNIWCKARQLGVSGMEEQQVIIEQLIKMEERDGLEAEKRGVSNRL